jgi:hypothetical protein
MNWFPQVGTGAVAQFPLQRKRQWRAITNLMESGELISLPDPNGGQIEWRLSYQDLTDTEVANLTSLFAASNGEAIPFGFVDPFANLLGWSENLTQPGWQPGLLTLSGGVNDPVGTQRAWTLRNSTPGEQMLSQTIGIPGSYTACFSVYIWSQSAGTIGILRDAGRTNLPIGPQWKRIQIGATGTSGATQSTFSLAIPAGASLNVFGLQVEAQPWPSLYRPTGEAAGILEETRFTGSSLSVTNTAPGLSSCQITLVSRIFSETAN